MLKLNTLLRTAAVLVVACAASAASAQVPMLNYVMVDNLGHLPMIVGAEMESSRRMASM